MLLHLTTDPFSQDPSTKGHRGIGFITFVNAGKSCLLFLLASYFLGLIRLFSLWRQI